MLDSTFFISIIGFFIVLTPLIFIHELGHYLAAIKSGVSEIIIERLKICNDCEHVRLKNTLYKRCAECGCFLRPKTKLLYQECPIGKWNEPK